MSTDKRALLIGINYPNTPNQLQGCINDVVEMKSLIIDAYGFNPNTIVTLRDDDPSNMPTRARILQELKILLANATSTTRSFSIIQATAPILQIQAPMKRIGWMNVLCQAII